MNFYLKKINPIVCIVILCFCLWAGIADGDGDIKILNIFEGSLSSYFLAKGLFCSSALFILGKILESILEIKKI